MLQVSGVGGLWRRVAERLDGRRVLMPDLPGYGKSASLEDYSFDRVLRLLEDELLGPTSNASRALPSRCSPV
jgi:pimeloyl-ACP methyl ester carboxylesterase